MGLMGDCRLKGYFFTVVLVSGGVMYVLYVLFSPVLIYLSKS